jgi:hypothetical protein
MRFEVSFEGRERMNAEIRRGCFLNIAKKASALPVELLADASKYFDVLER